MSNGRIWLDTGLVAVEIFRQLRRTCKLEMEKLCFKVEPDSSLPEEQDRLKWEWHQRITAHA